MCCLKTKQKSVSISLVIFSLDEYMQYICPWQLVVHNSGSVARWVFLSSYTGRERKDNCIDYLSHHHDQASEKQLTGRARQKERLVRLFVASCWDSGWSESGARAGSWRAGEPQGLPHWPTSSALLSLPRWGEPSAYHVILWKTFCSETVETHDPARGHLLMQNEVHL